MALKWSVLRFNARSDETYAFLSFVVLNALYERFYGEFHDSRYDRISATILPLTAGRVSGSAFLPFRACGEMVDSGWNPVEKCGFWLDWAKKILSFLQIIEITGKNFEVDVPDRVLCQLSRPYHICRDAQAKRRASSKISIS